VNELTAERLRERLSFDPDGCRFTWLPRSVRPHMAWTDKAWNTRYAGTIAGKPDSDGYRRINLDRRMYLEHRLIVFYQTGAWPEAQIDHINMDRTDNRPENLRSATQSQNRANTRMYANNRSGFKRVTYFGRRKWTAHIKVNGKQRTLGYFDSPERAFIEYIFAAWRHFGDFAKIDADYIRAVQKRRALETGVLGT
jgi:hypothetical protein